MFSPVSVFLAGPPSSLRDRIERFLHACPTVDLTLDVDRTPAQPAEILAYVGGACSSDLPVRLLRSREYAGRTHASNQLLDALRAAIPPMVARHQGRVILVTSEPFTSRDERWSASASASRSALDGVLRAWATELAAEGVELIVIPASAWDDERVAVEFAEAAFAPWRASAA